MPLTAQQLAALPVLEWLLDRDARATGRTLALAVAGIRQACRYPSRQVDIFDHHAPQNADNMLRVLQRLVSADPRLRPWAQLNRMGGSVHLTMRIPFAIPDWLPPDAMLSDREPRASTNPHGELDISAPSAPGEVPVPPRSRGAFLLTDQGEAFRLPPETELRFASHVNHVDIESLRYLIDQGLIRINPASFDITPIPAEPVIDPSQMITPEMDAAISDMLDTLKSPGTEPTEPPKTRLDRLLEEDED